jgi:WD40 repeat protein
MRVLKLAKVKRVDRLSFTPDGRQLAAVSSLEDEYVEAVVWLDAATGDVRRTIPLDAQQFALAPDHARVALAYSPYTRPGGVSAVRWADVPAGGGPPAWVDVPDLPHNHVYALAFAPDGGRLVIGCSGQRTSHLWESAIHVAPLGRGKAVTIPLDAFAGEVAFDSDGKWLAVTGGSGGSPAVQFFRYPAAEPAAVYTPKATRTRRLVFAPGRPALAALAGKRVVLLTAGRSDPVAVLDGHTARVDDAAYTPDGRRLLTAGRDGAVRVWDAATGAAAGAFAWPVGKLTALAVAPDGLTAAAAGDKGQIVVWDLDG